MTDPPENMHAFIKLLLEHQSALRAYIVSMMPGSDDADDVLQNTNVIIWEKMHEFEPGSNFRAWIFAIARNMVRSQHRSTRRFLATALDETLVDAIHEVWQLRPDHATSRRQRALDHCLETLKSSERELLRVRYSHGTNLQQHAEQTGRSADSLRSTVSRIRAKLRNCVKLRLAQEGDVQ